MFLRIQDPKIPVFSWSDTDMEKGAAAQAPGIVEKYFIPHHILFISAEAICLLGCTNVDTRLAFFYTFIVNINHHNITYTPSNLEAGMYLVP